MPKDSQLIIRCSEEQKAAAEALAEKMGLSVSETFRRLLTLSDNISGVPVETIKAAMDDPWFRQRLWAPYASGELRKAWEKWRESQPHPWGTATNGNGRLAHQPNCDCKRCRPPKEEKKA